jgi:alditol oxidase
VQSEFHVPRAAAGAAIVALREAADGFRDVLQVAELRTVAADGRWLSPQFERDTACFHFTWALDLEGVRRALEHVERALAPFDPRPHWGKVSLAVEGPVGRRYPRLDDFLALRERLDPERRFANPWLERVLEL